MQATCIPTLKLLPGMYCVCLTTFSFFAFAFVFVSVFVSFRLNEKAGYKKAAPRAKDGSNF